MKDPFFFLFFIVYFLLFIFHFIIISVTFRDKVIPHQHIYLGYDIAIFWGFETKEKELFSS